MSKFTKLSQIPTTSWFKKRRLKLTDPEKYIIKIIMSIIIF